MTTSYDWLEDLLLEEGVAFAPATPDLRNDVASRLARPATVTRPLRRVALAAAVAAALALALTLAVEPARTGVAEFFGLIEGYEIEIVEAPSSPVPRATAFATADPTADPTVGATAVETIAEAATRSEAEAFLGASIVFLDGRGTPAIFVTSEAGADFVILRYDDLDFWQTTQSLTYFGKQGPPGTIIETPLINGLGAYWVEGPRTIRFSPDVDAPRLDVLRNSLIWRGEGGRLYRIEADLPFAEVLAIAELLP